MSGFLQSELAKQFKYKSLLWLFL